jgi:hypothetical protein
VRAADARPASSKATPNEVEPVEVDFNFDEPLTPVDEGAHFATTTVRDKKDAAKTEATVEAISPSEKSDLAKTRPAPGKAASSAPQPAASNPGKPVPAAPAQRAATANNNEKDNQTVNFGAWDLDEKPDPKGESDDDFGDFLKSLETK